MNNIIMEITSNLITNNYLEVQIYFSKLILKRELNNIKYEKSIYFF